MHQQGGTIENALRRIESHEYVLPAIQREFVWQPEQVCNLFDSLMQGYPFGEFMLWRVNPENADLYRWYDFVREYHQRDNPHCPGIGPHSWKTSDGRAGWATTPHGLQHRAEGINGP